MRPAAFFSFCNCQTPEYRELFRDISDALSKVSEEWAYIVEHYFLPKCEVTGFCTEKRSCGRKPAKDEGVNRN